MSLYDELLSVGAKIDHHESDLYVKANDETISIVSRYHYAGECVAYCFFDDIDKELWLEVPFHYAPYWENKARENK